MLNFEVIDADNEGKEASNQESRQNCEKGAQSLASVHVKLNAVLLLEVADESRSAETQHQIEDGPGHAASDRHLSKAASRYTDWSEIVANAIAPRQNSQSEETRRQSSDDAKNFEDRDDFLAQDVDPAHAHEEACHFEYAHNLLWRRLLLLSGESDGNSEESTEEQAYLLREAKEV